MLGKTCTDIIFIVDTIKHCGHTVLVGTAPKVASATKTYAFWRHFT